MENTLQLNPNYQANNEHTFCYHVEIVADDGSIIDTIDYRVTTDGGEPGWEKLEGYFEERYPEADDIVIELIDVH